MAQKRTVQITVTTAGTAVQGPNLPCRLILPQAHPDNTGDYVIVGNDGADDVDTTTGFYIKKDSVNPPMRVDNLNELYFDVPAGGDGDKVNILIMSFFE